MVRTGLAKRLSLPEFSDKTPMPQRHYQALAPPPSAPVNSKVPATLAEGVEGRLAAAGPGGGEGGGAFVAPANKLEKACVELVAQVGGGEMP